MTAQNLPSEPEFEQAYKGMCHLISTRHTANEKKKKYNSTQIPNSS